MPDDDARRKADEALAAVDLGDWSVLLDDTADDLREIYGDGLAEGLRLTDMGVDLDQVNERALNWAREHAAALVTQIEENTRDMIRDTVAEGIEQGWSTDQLAAELQASAGFDEDRARVIARTECLTGETMVSAAVIRAAFRRWYDGYVVDIITAEGRKLTTTPNHPMLTRRGWVAADKITDTDYLVCDARQKSFRAHRDQNIDRSPPAISKLFDALAIAGSAKRHAGNCLDFHGDGRKSDVEIAGFNGELPLGSFAALYEPIIKDFLTPSDVGGVASFCSLCGGLLPIDQITCFCSGSQRHSSKFEPQRDGVLIHTMASRDAGNGLAGDVGDGDVLYRKVGIKLAIASAAMSFKSEAGGLGSIASNAGLDDGVSSAVDADATFGGREGNTQPRQIERDNAPPHLVRDLAVSHFDRFLQSPERFVDQPKSAFDRVTRHAKVSGDSGDRSSVSVFGYDLVEIELDRVTSHFRRNYAGHVYNLETVHGYFCITGGAYTGNTITAQNQGNLAGYKQARDSGVRVMKEWLVGGDPCPICEANADQGPIELDEDFDSGDDAPGAHPRCECAVAPYLPDEEGDAEQEEDER